ncbi:DUF1566 domain-containing protein [Thiospirillum jenense]|uniref:DUF1566 domain-containing protein n=1 Tax=Thiospirillum jenense TaxID=1653858 RepID=A0A839HDR9_9GAMM|nr:DUF1566 domain-containing protein [Thiospirillum jenense]MBB1127075.1 DUF1566 domain-containing protein [Thiospirillum jenense]
MQNNDSTQPTKNPAIPLDEELLRFLLEFGIDQRTDEYLRQLARLAGHAANIDKNYLRQLTQVATSVANTNKQLSMRLEQIEAQQQLFTGQLQQFNQAMTEQQRDAAQTIETLAQMELSLNERLDDSAEQFNAQIEQQQQLLAEQLQQHDQTMTAAINKLAQMEMLLNERLNNNPIETPRQPTLKTENPNQSVSGESELINGRYRDLGDGTVLDVKTNLQWMRCALGQTWDGKTCIGEAGEFDWDNAKIAAQKCRHAGFSDWRLPSIDELKTLIYCSSSKPKLWNDTGKPCEDNFKQPTIDQRAFPNTPSSWFWSGSPNPYYSNSAWYVSFNFGYDGNGRYDGCTFYVRLVRSWVNSEPFDDDIPF